MLCIVNAALIGADDLGYSSWTSALRASRLLGLIANTLERQYFFLSISSTHIDNQSQALHCWGLGTIPAKIRIAAVLSPASILLIAASNLSDDMIFPRVLLLWSLYRGGTVTFKV
jgi:hypothetical protein